jgi:hypothetical protein
MTNDDNDPWALEWEDGEFDDGEDFDDEDDVLYLPSEGLSKLIGVHGSVKTFANNPKGTTLLVQTLGQLEIAVRALGWRWSQTTTPEGHWRVNVTTADGREFSSNHCSGFACYLDPDIADPIQNAYHDAIKARVREG